MVTPLGLKVIGVWNLIQTPTVQSTSGSALSMLDERQFQLLFIFCVIGVEHSLLPLTVGKSHDYIGLRLRSSDEDGVKSETLY